MTERSDLDPPPRRWLQTGSAALQAAWATLRAVTGDDAYERYMAHWQEHHSCGGGEPLERAAFFREEQARKWNGLRRCC